MPFFKGTKTSEIVQQTSADDPHISSTLQAQEQAPSLWSEAIAKVAPDSTSQGAHIQRATDSAYRAVYKGVKSRSFLDDFRYRLLYLNAGIIVNDMAQGLVTQAVTLNLSIWNGWQEDTTVTQLDVTSGQGILVVGAGVGAPITALQEIPLQITILATGPAAFDATISIRLGVSAEVFTLRLSGVRISVPFLLDAEWASGLTVTKRYLTSVSVGATMAESRMSMRSNPIRKIEAPLFFGSTASSLQAYSSLRAVGTTTFLMPYPSDRSEMTQPQVARTIYCDTEMRRFKVGGYALIAEYNDDGSVTLQEAIKVLEIYPDRIVSEFDTVNNYLNQADVFPGMLCFPSLTGTTLEAVTGGVGTFQLAADEIYGETMLDIDNSEYTPTIINNAPVFPFNINWATSVSTEVFRGGETKASGRGHQSYVLGTGPGIATTATTTLANRTQSWEASGFMNHISGMGKIFWMRGALDMFSPSQVTGGGGLGFEIRVDQSISQTYLQGLKAMWFTDKFGTLNIVKVNEIIENPGYTSIFTDLATITTEDLESVHDALLVRLASDEVAETFITDELSEMTLTFREVVEAYE